MTDIFQEVKERLSARRVAELYGFHPNSSGFIPCPFHSGDRTASLKLYTGTKGWHCFGCNRGGSVIDFVAELFNLAPLEAVRKLNDDFRLGLPVDRPPDRATVAAVRQRQQDQRFLDEFMCWRDRMTKNLCECFQLARLTMKEVQTPKDLDKLSAGQVLAIQWEAYLEFLSDVLISGTAEQQMEVFRERGRISRLIERILGNSCQKSKAA